MLALQLLQKIGKRRLISQDLNENPHFGSVITSFKGLYLDGFKTTKYQLAPECSKSKLAKAAYWRSSMVFHSGKTFLPVLSRSQDPNNLSFVIITHIFKIYHESLCSLKSSKTSSVCLGKKFLRNMWSEKFKCWN